MSILYGIKAINQNVASSIPYIFGFNTARAVANDTLFELWNGPTNAGIKFAVDKDGKMYSAALAAGDLVTAVVGGIANVRRLDSIVIAGAGKVLRSTGAAPAWSTVTIPDTAAQGDLLFASLANVWTALAKGTARQVLQMNAGATLPEWTTDISLGQAQFSGTITMTAAASTLIPGVTSFAVRDNANANNNLLLSNAGLLTVRAGITVTGGATTLGGDLKFSTTQNIVAGAGSLNIRNNADNANNVGITDAGVVTIRAGLTVTAGSLTFGAAVGKLVPGVTSFSLRNNADNADNLIVTDAGLATVRAGVTVLTGDAIISAGNIAFLGATARLIPGVTSFSLRNNANNADNLIVTDAGAVTIRSNLSTTATINCNAGILVANNQTVSFTGPNGSLVLPANGFVSINALQVVGGRKTGWTLWTGTAARGAQNADAPPTLTQVAQAMKALIDDLHSSAAGHGLIGP